VASVLCLRGQCADGLVLNSGFTDLIAAVVDNALAMVGVVAGILDCRSYR